MMTGICVELTKYLQDLKLERKTVREREGSHMGEEGSEQGSLIDVVHCLNLQHSNWNLFLLQHLSDAKKAQQNLEFSLKNLESVSHVLLFHHIIVI